MFIHDVKIGHIYKHYRRIDGMPRSGLQDLIRVKDIHHFDGGATGFWASPTGFKHVNLYYASDMEMATPFEIRHYERSEPNDETSSR